MNQIPTRNYEKFFTPPEVADFMVGLLNPKAGELILEPSAGRGSIVKAIKRNAPGCSVFAIEINKDFNTELSEVADVIAITDFLELEDMYQCDGCIANPPFGNGIDLHAHVDQIRKFVVPDGKIVMIVPADFDPKREHRIHHLNNWSQNSDGTTTAIKIIEFIN